jgi:hypothetical protein
MLPKDRLFKRIRKKAKRGMRGWPASGEGFSTQRCETFRDDGAHDLRTSRCDHLRRRREDDADLIIVPPYYAAGNFQPVEFDDEIKSVGRPL